VSLLNQSSLLAFPEDQFTVLSKSLAASNPPAVRLRALNVLFNVPTADILSSKKWPAIRNDVQTCCLAGDDALFEHGLKFHVKLLSSQDPSSLKEGYVNALDTVARFFRFFDREGINRTWSKGLQLAENRWERLPLLTTN
jgi:hypothetical protein